MGSGVAAYLARKLAALGHDAPRPRCTLSYDVGSPCSAVVTMDSQILTAMGSFPVFFRSIAILAEFSPGRRMDSPESLTALRMDATFRSKSSTSALGSMAMSVCPHDFAAFFDSHWPSTAPPLSAPASNSTESARPAPLCPPNVAMAPPSSTSLASVVNSPSLPKATPRGKSSPLALAVSTPKRAMAEVAMSKVSGGADARGKPSAIGLVPKTALPPAPAATNSGELASAMPMSPLSAMRPA
mmetsp:Transcript_56615/g.130039  ORF Transcript_56615/g.130039 Transcript_56615/m.130039 type:complete len:242 (-) Transcript_56615:824-1549(-)